MAFEIKISEITGEASINATFPIWEEEVFVGNYYDSVNRNIIQNIHEGHTKI